MPVGVKTAIRRGIARALKRRVTTYRELAEDENIRCWYFDRERPFEFPPPEYANRIPPEINRLIGHHRSHQPFVIEVPDVELIGHQGLKLTAENKYIVYSFWEEPGGPAARELSYDVLDAISFGIWPLPRLRRQEPSHSFEVAVPLMNRWATNYSHWTEECLTQLQGLEHYEDATGVEPTIIVPPNPPAFIEDSLAAFGYTEDDYVAMPATRVAVERLVLPSVRRCRSATSGDYVREPAALRWVRDRVVDGLQVDTHRPKSPRRVFISRRDAESRRVVNRSEVEDRLENLGFETHCMT
ncbi:MAG: glycosyltransferase family 61 protein, partial [Halobacteriales archaeon]|nr:glycosyltransferase family 61 protein [Halobacteriales archaeon]